MKNTYDIPLAYVIRKELEQGPQELDEEHEIIYNARLSGSMFTRDSKKVLTLLKELTNGTPAETWMKGKRCGRDAMEALQSHYDGKAEGERRKAIARADFDNLFYKNETTFPLEKYTTKMKECHTILDKYGVPMHEEDKVHHFLDKINCPNDELKTEVNICRAQHSRTFDDSVTYMSSAVARIFPNSQPASGRYKKRGYRNVSSYHRGGRGGRGRGGRGGRGRGRGRGGNNSNKMENGVDISDPCRWYTKDEMYKLSADTKSYILNHPNRAAAIEARKRNKRNNSSTTTNNNSSESTGEDRLCAAVITGVMNAQNNVDILRQQDTQTNGSSLRFPVPGNRARSAAAANRTTMRSVPGNINVNNGGNSVDGSYTFDAQGNIVP